MPSAASAQSGVVDKLAKEQAQEAAAVYPSALSGTPLTAAGLIAGDGNKRVFVRYAFPGSSTSQVQVSMSAPLDETADRNSIIGLDGLANKAKLGVEWRIGAQTRPSVQRMGEITQELLTACQAKKTKEAAAGQDFGCDIVKDLLAPGVRLRDAYPDLIHAAWFLTLKGDVGPQTFKYVTPGAFAAAERKANSYSLAADLGVLWASNIYTTVGFRKERGYKAADSQAVCQQDAPTACALKIVGGPTPQPRRILEFEMRRYVRQDLGLQVIVSRDLEAGETSLEVPFYFIKDKDGGLNAGVAYGRAWSRDNTTGDRITVFVGSTFKLGR